MADKDETVYGHSSLSEAGIEIGLFPRDLEQELLVLNKRWSDTRRKPKFIPPPNDTSPLADVSYYKPGTSMQDHPSVCPTTKRRWRFLHDGSRQ
jgi:hypothetical protein